jgi:hypothetical protein
MNSNTSDFEKLQLAFQEITSKFGSLEDILEAFGLAALPTAQRYGILFGFVVFTVTVSAVMALLVFGGTFQRIAEEAETGKVSVESDYRVRLQRPLLLERLLDAQKRLLEQNYPDRPKRQERMTNLTKMLCSVVPPDETTNKGKDSNNNNSNFDFSNQRAEIMVGYKENYFMGYRKCQDKPGGTCDQKHKSFGRVVFV